MIDPREDPRLAGDVKRYHTWPVLQPQSVAEHSWNVARIVVAIWPFASQQLLQEALFHDVGEIRSGDAPFPVKAENPDLKATMDRIEDAARLDMLAWGVPRRSRNILKPMEHVVLKVADMLEMMEKGMQECLMGNQFAKLIVLRTREWLEIKISEMEHCELRSNIISYMGRRMHAWPMAIEPAGVWSSDMTGQDNPYGYSEEEHA